MPKIDFNVRGRISGLEVKEAYDKDGNKVDVSDMCARILALKLDYEELFIEIPIPNTLSTTLFQKDFVACRIQGEECTN